jgi:hypothetical protein
MGARRVIARRWLNLALCCALSVALSACGLCSDDIVAQAVSRDGQRKAWLNSRNCGATTAFYNTLSVEVPEEWGAVEVMSGELCMWRSDDATLRWEGDDLVLRCKSCCPERMESKTEKVGRTTIRFEGFDGPPIK